MSLLGISNFLLWILVLGLSVAVLAMARQIGVLYERIAPMGALAIDTGLKVGDPSPALSLTSLDGRLISIGGPRERSTLLFFMSPDCPVCKKLIPILRSFQSAERSELDVVLASDGVPEEHLRFYERSKLFPMPYLLSTELGLNFQVAKLPYAVLIDGGGSIRAKGLVNNREQLESLLTADELGVSSLQEFIRSKARNGQVVHQ